MKKNKTQKKQLKIDQSFVHELKKKYSHIVCFSPHLDDAVFSAGGTLAELSKKMPVTVVNVFTSAGDARSTLSAKQFLKQSKIASPGTLFKVRLNEDKKSLKHIRADVLDLNYTDALWRKKKRSVFPVRVAGNVLPEFVSLYPTYRYHVIKGNIHKQDSDLVVELARRFRNIVPDPTTVAVFAPVGVGSHVDHNIVRNACRLAFGKDVFYWLDFPYFAREGVTANEFVKENHLEVREVIVNPSVKQGLCKEYESQYDIVMPDKNVLTSSERFFHAV